MRHFRDFQDLTVAECLRLIELTAQLRRDRDAGAVSPRLPGRVLGLLFEKPSLRTRVSFESAIAHLGGSSIFLSGGEVGLGKRESVADFARVISTYVDLLAVRTFAHEIILELARYATCPVVNALSDESHPCQALADVCTIMELFGTFEGIKVVFVGDGNNVARELALATAYCGMEFVLSSPDGYGFSEAFWATIARMALPGTVRSDANPASAVRNADIVYTDVWTSMGQEAERQERKRVFSPYQVDARLMALAKPRARFMHCLPAHRGEEVTADVIDGPQSAIVLQAANRLHAQKALIYWLLTEANGSEKPA